MQYKEIDKRYQAALKELLETTAEAVGQALQDKITIKPDDPLELTAEFAPAHEYPILKLTMGSTTDAAYDHIFLMDKSLAGIIFSWMVGGDEPEEVGPEEIDAVKEVVAQVLGQLQAALEGEEFSFSAGEVQLEEVASADDLALPEEGLAAVYKFTRGKKKKAYAVTHVVKGEVAPDPAEASAMENADDSAAEEDVSDIVADVAEEVVEVSDEGKELTEDTTGDLPLADDILGGAADMSSLFGEDADEGSVVEVSPADFGDLGPSQAPANGRGRNIDMLLDVQLDVTVELGRKDMMVEEILRLGKGSIVELDKLAGEPVDVLVNGKKLAEGEVVVVEDHFGVRLTHLLEASERIKSLGK